MGDGEKKSMEAVGLAPSTSPYSAGRACPPVYTSTTFQPQQSITVNLQFIYFSQIILTLVILL